MPALFNVLEREWGLIPTIIRVDRKNNFKSPIIAFFYRDNFGGLRRLYDCEEQSKDSFYCEFVLQSIINKFATYWVWQGGGVAYLNEVDKTLFLYVR